MVILYSPITALYPTSGLLCDRRPRWGLISIPTLRSRYHSTSLPVFDSPTSGLKMRISAVAATDIPHLPKSANTLAYTRFSSSTNMSHIGSDQRPSTDESYEDMMYKIHRYTTITAQLRHWTQLSYKIVDQDYRGNPKALCPGQVEDTDKTPMHHPELASDTIRVTAPDTIHIANIGAGGLWSDWTP
jgi:hypothetical protein